MDCTVSTTALDGVTLVSAIVENPHAGPARFRLQNDLDGPVWPPRQRGYPEPGWDDSGYEGVLEAGGRVSLGYAVPAEPVDPPARIAWTEPADSTDRPADSADSTARSFGGPRPPRSVLGPPEIGFSGQDSIGEWP